MSVRRQAVRTESDLLGEVAVPARALYGAQTRRAELNFPAGRQKTMGDHPEMVRALIEIKEAAAGVNLRRGFLPARVAGAILASARAVKRGGFAREFPIHALHGGGGTSANMNANEVLANLAEERLGGRRGQYRLVHPNDHVNLHQSTNDVYPTACHLAVLRAWGPLEEALGSLAGTLAARRREFRGRKRLARTCLQDAVDVTWGDLLGGYEGFVRRAARRVGDAVDQLHAVNLGGTIVGRAEDAPAAYRRAIVPELRKVTGLPGLKPAADLFDAAQNADDLAVVGTQLGLLARGLLKIAQDFRWLSSGPEGGLGEIRLPAVQPGSSIMPGKVNPVIPEFLIQACFQAMGAQAVCEAALEHGELDLNVWESALVFNLLDAMDLLRCAAGAFAAKCVAGFRVEEAANAAHCRSIIPQLTRAMRRHGYSPVSAACKEGKGDPDRIRRVLAERGLDER
jgi:aspartate ammonia-lyase